MAYRVKILTDNSKIKHADLFSMKHLYFWHEANDVLQRIYIFMQRHNMTEASFEFHVYDGRRDLYVIEKNIATLSPYDKTNLRGLLDRSFQYDTDDRSIERINRISRAIDIQIEDEETYPEKYESLGERQRAIYDNHFNGVYKQSGLKGLFGAKIKSDELNSSAKDQVLANDDSKSKKGLLGKLFGGKKKDAEPDNIQTDATSFTAQIHGNVNDILEDTARELSNQNTEFLNDLRSKIKAFDSTDAVSDLIGNYHQTRVSSHIKEQIDTIQQSLSSLKERTTQAMLSKVARYDKKLLSIRTRSLDFNRLYNRTREDGFDPNTIVNDDNLSIKKKNLKIINAYRKYMTKYADEAREKYTDNIKTMNKTFKDSMNDLVDTYMQKENVGLTNIKRLYQGKSVLVDDSVNLVKLLKDEEKYAEKERLSQRDRKRYSAQAAEEKREEKAEKKNGLLEVDAKKLSKENKRMRLKEKLHLNKKDQSAAEKPKHVKPKAKSAKKSVKPIVMKNADVVVLQMKTLFARIDVRLLAVVAAIICFVIGYIIL